MSKRLFVISDLHIGRNDAFDIFSGVGKTEALCSFLEFCGAQSGTNELVINGDFIDFLQLRPWDSTDVTTAEVKIEEVLKANTAIFNALTEFVSTPGNELKILLGNHDVELAFPRVGRQVIDAITKDCRERAARVTLFDSRITYNPTVNGVQVHIEHGNSGDMWNAIDYDAVFRDAEIGTRDFSYPPGTELVYGVMNSFKEVYRFVDLLKPEIPAVPLLLLALKPHMASGALPQSAAIYLEALKNGFLSKLRGSLFGARLGPQAPEFGAEAGVLGGAGAWVPELGPDWPDARVVEHFFNSQAKPDTGATATLGLDLGPLKRKFIALALRGLARFAFDEESDGYYAQNRGDDPAARGARGCLRGHIKVVIFGHTHEALKAEFNEGVYVNSGTWANIIRLPGKDDASLLAWYDELRDNSFRVLSKPTYVCVAPAGVSGVNVSLNLWAAGGSKVLWERAVSQNRA